MNWRNQFFWLLDRLRGTGIARSLSELEMVNGAPLSLQAVARRNEALQAILTHATRSVPFYKVVTGLDLPRFPVINKSTIRAHPQAFLCATFPPEKLVPVVTSGSTGTPFKTFRNQDKVHRNTADIVYFASLAGFKVGEPLYYLKIWNAYNRKSQIAQFAQNVIPVNVLELSANALNSLVHRLMADHRRKHLLGYSSALEQLGLHVRAHDLRMESCNVASIIAMSEALNDHTRATLGHAFGVQPLSRYSNIENGIIAQQTPSSNGQFLVNVASYEVEVLDLSADVPAKPGQIGRIVVTDLYNYGMPSIRYDTGDIGAFALNSVGEVCSHVLACVEGRKLDQLFNTSGTLLSSYIVVNSLWKYTGIKQYQLIQLSQKEYVFKLNVNGGFARESELKAEFQKYLGNDASLAVEYVDEIPLLASGKRKSVVNKHLEQTQDGEAQSSRQSG